MNTPKSTNEILRDVVRAKTLREVDEALAQTTPGKIAKHTLDLREGIYEIAQSTEMSWEIHEALMNLLGKDVLK